MMLSDSVSEQRFFQLFHIAEGKQSDLAYMSESIKDLKAKQMGH
jgi:hypothetical protein